MRRCQSRPPHLAPESRLGSNHRQRVDFGATSLHISVTPPIQSATEAGHVGWSRRGQLRPEWAVDQQTEFLKPWGTWSSGMGRMNSDRADWQGTHDSMAPRERRGRRWAVPSLPHTRRGERIRSVSAPNCVTTGVQQSGVVYDECRIECEVHRRPGGNGPVTRVLQAALRGRSGVIPERRSRRAARGRWSQISDAPPGRRWRQGVDCGS